MSDVRPEKLWIINLWQNVLWHADCMCGRKHKHSRNTTECPWKKLSILTYHFSPLFFATFIRRKYDEVMKDRWKMQRCFIFHLWKNYFSFLLSALKLLTFNFSRVYDTQTGRVYVCLQRIVFMGRLGQTFIETHILLFFLLCYRYFLFWVAHSLSFICPDMTDSHVEAAQASWPHR